MKKILLVLGLFLFPHLAEAQTSRNPCYTTTGQTGLPNCVGVGTGTPLPVGIDQTIPGTTNGMVVLNPLSTGTAGIPATDQVVSQQHVNAAATGNITTQNLNPTSGTPTANSTVSINTYGVSCTVQVTGTYSGSLSLQWTVDSINWITSTYSNTLTKADSLTQTATITSATQSIWIINAPSNASLIRVTALGAQTGTAVVTINCSNSASIPVINIAGLAGHGSTASGFPVLVGGSVVTTAAAALSSGTAARMPVTSGLQIIDKPYAPSETAWTYPAATGGITNTTTAVTMQTAGAASIRNYITGCQIYADALGATTEVAIRDGAAGTVLWRTKIGTSGIVNGLNLNFAIPLKGTAATLIEVVTLTSSVTGSVFINCQGYQGP